MFIPLNIYQHLVSIIYSVPGVMVFVRLRWSDTHIVGKQSTRIRQTYRQSNKQSELSAFIFRIRQTTS
jgi:hypothetical protein